MTRWAAVLAGGSGVRFWPLSTPTTPKQFLPLSGDRPLLCQAVDRLAGLIPTDRIFVVTGRHLERETRRLLPEIPEANILAEPRTAGTGPALCWATLAALDRDPSATLLSVHADWYVGDDHAFRDTAEIAMEVAETHDSLVTVGIVPTRPDSGYGYVVPGQALSDDASAVAQFVEKPKEDMARRLIAKGALWNAAVFSWTGERFVAETRAHAHEIAPHLALLEGGNIEQFFEAVTPVVIDVSHYERSQRVAVVRGNFPWDDVGTWGALARVRPADPHRNVLVGRVRQVASTDCVVWSQEDDVVLYGVSDLVVAKAHGVTLVTTKARAATLKEMVAGLPRELRELS